MRRVKKSRTGCARCKSKRVKCGEEKPHCVRCTRLGVKCPGYIQSLRWVTKYEQPSSSNNNNQHQSNQSPPEERGSPSFRSSPSPHPSNLADPDPHSPVAFNAGLDPTATSQPAGLDSQGTTALCDNLWDLQGTASLPELADLCAPSIAATGGGGGGGETGSQRDTTFDFTNTSDALFLFPWTAPVPQNDHRTFQGFSPSTIVRSYPPSSSKSLHRNQMSISRPLNNPSWTLIEYYFKEVAALFSSYDSQMNPFRSTVSRLWGSSLAMCRTMQSMAAATLVNDFPQFGPIGLKMRNEAVDIITKESEMDDKSLLALLMLGQTASWHDSKDLGISFFNLLRKHLHAMSSDNLGYIFRDNRSNNHQFFEEALIYWEMLLSFVADNDAVPITASSLEESIVLQQVPHPWTGIARDTQFTVKEVGRLVRRERKRIRTRTFTSQEDIVQAQRAIDQARGLEERLLGLAHPTEAEIVSPGDDETPVWHLLTMAEVYRCTGLMQLYRAFPDLLHRRLPMPNNPPPPSPTNRDPFLSIDPDNIMDNMTGFLNLDDGTTNDPQMTTPASDSEPSPASLLPPPQTPDASYYDSWLAEFALTTLSRLKTIPLESRTRCLQPFLLVAASSELRLPKPTNTTTSSAELNPDPDTNNPTGISSHAIDISTTRRFVLGRLTSFLHVLPPKPIEVCLLLVREVWKRMDAGEPNVYWMDVMIEKGWETTMG